MNRARVELFFFFFNDTATTEIYTLSLHDALPIYFAFEALVFGFVLAAPPRASDRTVENIASLHFDEHFRRAADDGDRSEEHTSELQSRLHLVCRLLLEKKKKQLKPIPPDLTSTDR